MNSGSNAIDVDVDALTVVVEVILERILKTLIFIDGRKKVSNLAKTIRG